MTMHLPEPTALLGSATGASLLGIDQGSVEALIEAGLAGPPYVVGSRLAAEAELIRALADRPMFDPSDPTLPPALVVKVKPALPVEDGDRAWMGWHADLTPEEQADGVRGWWSVRDPDQWIGRLLVATIAGFVVGVWRIRDVESFEDRLHRFEVESAGEDDAEAARYHGQRMKPIRGGVLLHLPMI